MVWLFYAGVVVFGATGIHFFSKLSNVALDPVHLVVFTMAMAFLFSLCFLPLATQNSLKYQLSLRDILLYSAVGLCVAVAHLGIFYMFRAGAPMSIATPLVRFAPAVLAVLLGYLVFQEQLRLVQIIGIILAAFSVMLVTRS